MIVNYHTHTPRCHHAVGQEREYVENAIRAGLKTLGFADHAPMVFEGDYYSNFRMTPAEIEGYVNTLLALREEYKKDINLLIGFETEYYPKYFDKYLQMISPYPIDYIIMGQHFVGNEIGARHNYQPTDSVEQLTEYVDQVLEGLSTGCFSYLAHPDMINFTGSDEAYYAPMKKLCEGAKKLDVPLELNMLGVWEGRIYPCERFFRIAGAVGNDVILGIDAHQPQRILEEDVLNRAHTLADKCGVHLVDDVRLRPLPKK
ncbi:MAG: histidinol-phosphatase [Clostridia bacterium]|nr:histidinol-phosphatase [Clostridia bacterium]